MKFRPRLGGWSAPRSSISSKKLLILTAISWKSLPFNETKVWPVTNPWDDRKIFIMQTKLTNKCRSRRTRTRAWLEKWKFYQVERREQNPMQRGRAVKFTTPKPEQHMHQRWKISKFAHSIAQILPETGSKGLWVTKWIHDSTFVNHFWRLTNIKQWTWLFVLE